MSGRADDVEGERRMSEVSGWQQVVLANDHLRAVVLPGRGGDILSLEHLPSATSLLWRAPWQTPPGPHVAPGAGFLDWYQGGWQDLLPNGGPPCVVDGVEHDWHGESWRRAWTVVEADGAGLELEVTLETLPLRVRKRIELDGPTLRVRERIEHAGDEPVRMLWGQHPAWGGELLEAGCRVDLPGGRTECYGVQIQETSELADAGEGRWPLLPGRAGGSVDLSRVPGPEHGTHDLCAIGDLAAGWYALRNPRRGIGVALRFPHELFRWLWMWRPFGGVDAPPLDGRTYALAIEPWTGPSPSLAAGVERGEALRLAPGEAVAAEIELTVFAASDVAVVDVGRNGQVIT